LGVIWGSSGGPKGPKTPTYRHPVTNTVTATRCMRPWPTPLRTPSLRMLMMATITPLRAIPSLGAHGQPPIWVMTAYGPPPIPVIQTRGPHPAMAWIHPYPSVHHPSVHPYAMAVGSIRREGYGANGTRDGGPYTTMALTTTSTTTTYGGSCYCYTSPQLMVVSWPPAHCTYPSNTNTGIPILPSAGLHAIHGHQQGHGREGHGDMRAYGGLYPWHQLHLDGQGLLLTPQLVA